MDTFDYVIVILGIFLILIGLFLFISGKRDSETANNVEGFGIKLNVSNPSIILIVFGIGLVLFPRLMPQQSVTQFQPFEQQTNAVPVKTEKPSETPQQTSNSSVKEPNAQPNVYFPNGSWFLSSYEENSVDLSNSIDGTIRFTPNNTTSLFWQADMTAMDGWGNMMNYQYEGTIDFNPSNGYVIDTIRSNDPSFMYHGPTSLTLKLDADKRLHMEYFFNGSAIMMHWQQ